MKNRQDQGPKLLAVCCMMSFQFSPVSVIVTVSIDWPIVVNLNGAGFPESSIKSP
jgi:hypothetical protein